jgi:hypothetical protein
LSPTHSGELLNEVGLFQLWFYSVSHGTLLIRRVPESGRKRLDILFVNVQHIHLPTRMERFILKRVESAYSAEGTGWSGTITAGNVLWKEDELDYDAPSAFGDACVVPPGISC